MCKCRNIDVEEKVVKEHPISSIRIIMVYLLFDDVISKVGRPVSFRGTNSFKPDTVGADIIKQTNPFCKQYGGNMHMNLIKERRFEALLGHCRSTQLFACSPLVPPNGNFNAF